MLVLTKSEKIVIKILIIFREEYFAAKGKSKDNKK